MPFDGGIYEGVRMRLRTPEPVLVGVSEGGRWYVVYTRVLCEAKAARELAWRGFETYLPLRAPEGRERLSPKDRPAYPRYCFVRLNTSAPGWAKVFSTPGVADLVRGAEGELYALPAGVLERVRDREIEGLHYRKPPRGKFKCGFLKGEMVRIKAGSLTGFPAVFERALDPDTVDVTVLLFGRATRVTLPLGAIEATQ